MIKLREIVFLFLIFKLATSCVSYKDIVYFRSDDMARQIDSTILSIQNSSPLKIQKNDVLTITVRTFEQELALPFNIASANGGLTQSASPFNTYQVDEDGDIDFPVLGKILLEGKTINEAKDTVSLLLKNYLENPSINMRLINFRVSVLGEVKTPGTFLINSDKITLLEAIALAEDLTPYGNSENILVIREQNGGRTFGEVNLQSTSFISSEFYYLRQGDVIYVEPRRDKQAIIKDNGTEVATLIAIGAQTLASIATIIFIATR